MTANGTTDQSAGAPEPPASVRRLDSESAVVLGALVELFEDLQTVLKCCERLVGELAPTEEAAGAEPDAVLVESVWTLALLSYARCFSAGAGGVALDEDDLVATQPAGEVVEFHKVLLQLRDHQADPVANPRERFSVGVTQDAGGLASGVAITSARQPLVDDFTVRQTGAVAYALSGLVNARIEAQQEKVFTELKGLSKGVLDDLDELDVTPPAAHP